MNTSIDNRPDSAPGTSRGQLMDFGDVFSSIEAALREQEGESITEILSQVCSASEVGALCYLGDSLWCDQEEAVLDLNSVLARLKDGLGQAEGSEITRLHNALRCDPVSYLGDGLWVDYRGVKK